MGEKDEKLYMEMDDNTGVIEKPFEVDEETAKKIEEIHNRIMKNRKEILEQCRIKL